MSNVLPFKRPEASKKQKSGSVTSGQETLEHNTLEQVAEKNRQNQERLKAERLADTKKVLQSYRIKS